MAAHFCQPQKWAVLFFKIAGKIAIVASNSKPLFENNSSLSRRSIGAVFVFFPTVLTAWLGGWWFTALIFVVALLATREMVVLMRASGFMVHSEIALLAFGIGFALARFPNQAWSGLAISALLLGTVAWQMRNRGDHPIADWGVAVIGGLYIGWCGGNLAAVRELGNGWWWLVLTIGTTWIADSAAYFVGKSIGKHKLTPKLSPKKTWEGYLGGVAAGVLFGLLLGVISPLGMGPAIIAAGLVGALGTLGDLAESMFKRQANAKDSGTLIPGQGGAFDRIDSLMWAGVVVYHFATWIA